MKKNKLRENDENNAPRIAHYANKNLKSDDTSEHCQNNRKRNGKSKILATARKNIRPKSKCTNTLYKGTVSAAMHSGQESDNDQPGDEKVLNISNSQDISAKKRCLKRQVIKDPIERMTSDQSEPIERKTSDQLESCSVQINHVHDNFAADKEVNQGNYFNSQKTSTVTGETIKVSNSSDASSMSGVLIPDSAAKHDSTFKTVEKTKKGDCLNELMALQQLVKNIRMKKSMLKKKTSMQQKPKTKARIPGLVNIGNTCWLNSVIQALAAFSSFIITGRFRDLIA